MSEEEQVVNAQEEQVEEASMRVVETDHQGNGKVVVVVEGSDLNELMSAKARDVAYQERLKFGMANAGVEARGGTYIDPEERRAAMEEGRPVDKWRRDFAITQML